MLDLYCERHGPGLWAEPFNATSNVAFALAALAAWRLARRRGALTPGVAGLVGLTAAIAAGSTLFHTFATPWAQVLDVVPIWLFQLLFLWIYLRRAMGLTPGVASLGMAAYLATCGLTLIDRTLVNGSIIYAPTLAVLIGLAGYHLGTDQPGRWLLPAAAVVFALALVCRTVDAIACPYVPVGTHFLWHLLNGALLYLAMRALIVGGDKTPGQARPIEGTLT